MDEADKYAAGQELKPGKDVKRIGTDVPRVLTVKQILTASMERAFETQPTNICTTGNHRLDYITGGFKPGFVWVMGADTSWGKSSFLIMLADENLKRGKRVLIVSSEDTEGVYGDRLMVRRARINAMNYRDRRLADGDHSKVTDVVNNAESLPVYVDARRWPMEKLRGHLDKIIKEQNIDLIAFDYLQEFRSNGKHQDERIKFREIASIMRDLVKSNKRSGIIFSQLTINQDTRVPTKHNIRECRDVANAAEVILIGHQPDCEITVADGTTYPPNTKMILVDKVKDGPRGAKFGLSWDEECACFNTETDPAVNEYDAVIGDTLDDFEEGDRFGN